MQELGQQVHTKHFSILQGMLYTQNELRIPGPSNFSISYYEFLCHIMNYAITVYHIKLSHVHIWWLSHSTCVLLDAEICKIEFLYCYFVYRFIQKIAHAILCIIYSYSRQIKYSFYSTLRTLNIHVSPSLNDIQSCVWNCVYRDFRLSPGNLPAILCIFILIWFWTVTTIQVIT